MIIKNGACICRLGYILIGTECRDANQGCPAETYQDSNSIC